jgi:hypothetical protein
VKGYLQAVEEKKTKLQQSAQEQRQILASQIGQTAALGTQDRIGECAFGALQLQYLLFDGVLGDQPVGKDGPGLADPVRSVNRLSFDRRVPPGIEQEDYFRLG